MRTKTMCIVVLLLACFLISCKEHTSGSVSESAFAAWFTGTEPVPPDSFKKLTAENIALLCTSLREQCGRGAQTVDLTDSNGIMYTLGFRTPDTCRTDSIYPCVIYLHGGTGSESNRKGERAYEMLSLLADSAGIFLASPSANRDCPWWSPSGISRILQTVRFMSLYYPIDPKRIILAGVSDGATGCYAAANSVALPFAGFIAVSGFGGMLQNLGVELFPANLMQRPIYNVNAGEDRLYPVASVNAFLDALEQAGVGVERKTYANEQHGFDYREFERGSLTAYVHKWRKPDVSGVVWRGMVGYPSIMNQVFAFDVENGTLQYSIEAVFNGDRLTIKTSGLRKLQMYFADDTASVGRLTYKLNGSGWRSALPDRKNWKSDFIVMKQSCTPVLRKMKYVTFK